MKLKKLTGNEPVTITVEGYTKNINQFNFTISGTLKECLIMIDNACVYSNIEKYIGTEPNYKQIIKRFKSVINDIGNERTIANGRQINTFSFFEIGTPFDILNLLD